MEQGDGKEEREEEEDEKGEAGSGMRGLQSSTVEGKGDSGSMVERGGSAPPSETSSSKTDS